MFGQITAVAIDDEPSHLLAITTGLSAGGIACTGFWYDRDAHSLSPAPPKGGLPCLRLIFMDLNLEELGGNPDPANLAGTVMNVLEQVVAPDGGPYLLIFWTQVSGKVHAVADLIYARLTEIPAPLQVLTLAKAKFIVPIPKEQGFGEALKTFYIELHKSIQDLHDAITEVITKNPQLAALASWESRAAEAAGRTANEVYRCALEDAKDPRAVSESIQNILAEIARSASGAVPASEQPARALDAGMADILIDQIGASVEVSEYQEIVKQAIGKTLADAVKPGIQFTNRARVAADLNTFFHIDRNILSVKMWDRGAVVPAKPPLDKNALGFAPRDLFTTEFLFPVELFPENKQDEARAFLAEFRPIAEFVLIELGADCDHAQEVTRTRRFLLGLEVPEKYLSLARFHTNNKLRNESLQLLGPWIIKDEIKYLLVSCRRFWAWQKSTPPPAAAVNYRLRGSLVNKLLHHYSVWHSRPGIVEFRP